jgi:hypothetical protein
MTNEELVQRAIITAGDLAAAGKLNDVQSTQYTDYVIDVTELRGSVRVVRFRGENLQIDKIGVGQRVSVPKEEAKDPGLRRGISTSKVTLTPREVMTPFEISDTFAEHSIEGEAVEDTVMRLMATQTANDLEELLIAGDKLGPARIEADLIEGGSGTKVVKDTFLALVDGWFKLLDGGNVYDAEGANVSSKVFSGMIKRLPVKFRRSRRNLRFLMALDLEQNWREKVATRMTGKGDDALSSSGTIPVYGIPMIAVPLLDPEPRVVKHVTLAAAGGAATSLGYAPIGTEVYVTPTTLGSTPTTPYIEDTDYVLNRAAGTIAAKLGGALAAGGNVKVTFHTRAQIGLTDFQNLILAIGREIRIETDRDIFKGVNQFAITTKVDAQIEEVTATVKGINIGLD